MSGSNRFKKELLKYPRVAIDAMCFIYHFEENKTYRPLTVSLFQAIEDGKVRGATSLLTVAEIFSNKRVIEDKELAATYKEAFKSWPGIEVVQPDWEIVLQSGQIRIAYKIPLPDAIQIATAIVNKTNAFITNDERLKKVKKPKILLLDDYVK